jgi:hypothetical protein
VKRILFFVPGLSQDELFDPNARDNIFQPFIYLRHTLRNLGYELIADEGYPVKGCDWIWFWDVPRRGGRLRRLLNVARGQISLPELWRESESLFETCVRSGLQDRLALFLGEPAVIARRNWETELHQPFKVIFTWNDEYVDGVRYHKFNHPIPQYVPKPPVVPFAQKKLLVNISGNKFSKQPGELYTARRDAIRYFEQVVPDQFDLYGTGWNQVELDRVAFKSYRGTVKHKWDVYPYYRFGLTYENCFGVSGYITEKLFDCMRAGCVPIYWGAPNINQFVDQDAFIHRDEFKTNDELADYLLSMSSEEYEQRQQCMRAYLESERFAAFLPAAFANTIVRVLEL